MNKRIAWFGSLLVAVSVILFAVFMLIWDFGSYFVCMFLALGYIMMIAGFQNESSEDRKVAANVGMIFGCIYAVLVLMVYFAQTTAVRNDVLNEQAVQILDFARGGLFFSYDLLGYGMMALSTFFMGVSDKFTMGEIMIWFYGKTTGYTDKLKINDSCIGCGLCSRECPMGNIKMEDKWENGIHYIPVYMVPFLYEK